MRKYLACTWTTFKNTQVYKLDIGLKMFGSFILLMAMRETWQALYASGGGLESSSGVTLESMMAYSVMSTILMTILPANVGWEVSRGVSSGNIVLELQKPWNYVWYCLWKELGITLYQLIYIALPLFILSLVLYSMPLPGGKLTILFMFSILFAIILSFIFEFIVGMLAFIFTETWGFRFIKTSIISICSGSFVPLWYYPDLLRKVLEWLPFLGIYQIPLSLWIGELQGADAIHALMFQAGWCAVLLIGIQLMLKGAEKLLITSGG